MSTYAESLEQAILGGVLLTTGGTTSATGKFGGIKAIEDTVIDSITGDGTIANLSDIEDSVTVSAGDYIPMRFSAITITSGACIAVTRP